MAMSFFLRLILGHLIGDFVLQPYWLVIAKRNGWPGLLIHVGVVTLVTAILVWSLFPVWWVWIIVLYLGHLFIDQFRTFVFTDNTNGKGLLLLMLDQIAHVMLIGLLAWAATGWQLTDLRLLFSENAPNQYRLMAYLSGLAILVGVVPILEVEITVAVWAFQGRQVNHTVGIETSDRALGALERIGATFVIVSGYGWIAPLLFGPRLIYLIYQGQARVNPTAVTCKVATSFVSTILVSLVLSKIPIPEFIF
jgi:hypothetical protein